MSNKDNIETITIAPLALNWADELNLSYVQVLSEEDAQTIKAAKMLLNHAESVRGTCDNSPLLEAIREKLGNSTVYVGSNQEVYDVSINFIRVDVRQVSPEAANLAKTIAELAMPVWLIIESLILGLGDDPVFCEATNLTEIFKDLNLPSGRNVMEVLGFQD